MNTPANGPMSEYGRYKTVKAAAAAPGLGKLVALKNTYAPSPAVNMPSPACEISLVANRRRKFRSARTARRSPTKECCAPDRRQGRRPAVMGGRRRGALAGTGEGTRPDYPPPGTPSGRQSQPARDAAQARGR
jgi:hypothetical protein